MMTTGTVRYTAIAMLCVVTLASMVNCKYILNIIKYLFRNINIVTVAWIILFLGILNIGKIESDDIVAANFYQLAMVTFAGLIVACAAFIRMNAMPSLKLAIVALFLYGIFGIVSAIYSPFPALSLYKSMLVILSVIICLLILSYDPQGEHVRHFFNLNISFYFLLLMSFIVGLAVSPEKALVTKEGMMFGMLEGWIIRMNPNAVGFISGITCLFCLNKYFGQKSFIRMFLFLSLLVVTFWSLIMAQSRTCVLAFLCASFVILLLRKKYLYILIFVFMALSLVVFHELDLYRGALVKYYERGQTEKQLATWSGRLTAWKFAWQKFQESPILGYGMGAGVRFGALGGGLTGSHLHNSYFEVLLNSGLMGFIPWFFCLASSSWSILKKIFKKVTLSQDTLDMRIGIASLMVFSLIRSIAGTTFVLFDFTFMLYMSILAYSSVRADGKPS